MADWSRLLPELVVLIAKCLEARLDILRFRSVCSSWRSSVPLPPKLNPLLPTNLPLPRRGRDATDHHRVEMQLLNPPWLERPPRNFPKVLDLTNFQVLELGHEHVGHYDVSIDHPIEAHYATYRLKVVFLRSSTIDSDDFIMFSIKEWIVLENVGCLGDIISFNGKFYAIDGNGRTIAIDQSLNVRCRKFLVKSVDNLLFLEMFWEAGNVVHDSLSLRDRILFMGFHEAISAPASEFGWGRGNLIFYPENLSDYPGFGNHEYGIWYKYMLVFDLETGTASRLENCPAYRNLFWPPPEWVTSSTEVISNSAHSITSATSKSECTYLEPDLAISPTANTLKIVTSSASKEVGTEHLSPSSKCSFKFCFF
ncbi:hypothetical protein ES332_A01G203600v1 [Gossypium tomentosum]|uniref:KIB1-4 beta-propeller domain-containing protein n=1 Tax=Gossypium tomentosum TaxID=34277 RepID=A0A5D2RVB8_GOSTO|nr:hypothetical protein ES332_A01G203600v1 [Gossypium tomentosum]